MEFEINGTLIETDPEGYLQDLSLWSEGLAKAIAEREGLSLTQNHWEVVTFRRKGARVFRRNGATWKGRIRVSNGYQEWLDFSRFATGDLAPSGSALGVR